MTDDEIQKVLDEYWDKTGDFDPWLNGQMDAALEGVTDPDDRGRVIERFQLHHDWMVGQRMAVSVLRGKFRDAARVEIPT